VQKVQNGKAKADKPKTLKALRHKAKPRKCTSGEGACPSRSGKRCKNGQKRAKISRFYRNIQIKGLKNVFEAM